MTKHLCGKCMDKIEFYHVDYCSFVQWRQSLNILGASYERVYDEDLLLNDSQVIQRKKFRLQVLVVNTSTQQHEEAFEKDGDEPGMAPFTNDPKVMKILSAVIQKIRTRPSRTARENGDDGNEEQADAKNENEVEGKHNSDLGAARKKEIKESDSNSNELRELVKNVDKVSSQKQLSFFAAIN